MYYSITFGEGNDIKNTWSDWGLVPGSPPVIASPKPKTNYVDIPGRVKGPLDLSDVPFNRMTYERMSGSWEFVIYEDYWVTPNRVSVYEAVRKYLHGQKKKMKLEDDPNHYYIGRFEVSNPESGKGLHSITISYSLEPVRYNMNGTLDNTWLS